MFARYRLTFARKRRGKTKTELANIAGLTQQAISDFESGRYSPTEETLLRLAEVLNFPVDFFTNPEELIEPSVDTASFRALKKMTASKRDSALCAGALAFLLNEWLEKRFVLPKIDLLDLRDVTPELAAIALRQHWNLADRPIKNMVHLLESKGIRVYSLAEDSLAVDAFSCWQEGKPFVFLNNLKSAEHSRFDAAHELGHLVLHLHGAPNGQNAEKEANSFASAFLMPESSVRSICRSMPTLSQIIKLKHNWIVSVSALTYRLKQLNMLTEWHHRTLVIEISQRGYRVNEPEEAQRETSLIFPKVFNSLKNDGINKNLIAKDLQMSPDELNKLIFGLTMLGIPGGNMNTEKYANKADLHRIK